MRVLCALLPHFPLRCETQRHPDLENRPVAITYSTGSKKLILDYSPDIAHFERDMSLQQALSLHGDIDLVNADIPYYRAVFNNILDALEEKSPTVEGAEFGYAYVGLNGMQSIYPKDSLLINAIHQAIPEVFAVQIGIAKNKFLSYLAALYSPPGGHQILPDSLDGFLKDLPVNVLPVSIKSKYRLRNFGIGTLGGLAAMPLGPIQAQFGREGKRIWELARGQDDTPLYPRFMEQALEDSATLNSVTVSIEAILAAAKSLLSRFFASSTLKGRGIYSLILWTQSENSENWQKSIRFKEPAMNISTAVSRIRNILENYPQPGPVEQVGIKITGLGYPRARQKSLFPEVRAQEHLIDGIKQLELQLGSPQVFEIKEIEPWSRIPERRYALTPLNK